MRSVCPCPTCAFTVTSPPDAARAAARVTHAGAAGGLNGAPLAVRRNNCRSGMCSSSTASTTWPRAWASSISRMFAARMSCSVAASSDASSCDVICDRITVNRPPPNSTRMRPNVAAYHAVRPSRMRVSGCMWRASPAEAVPRAAHRLDQPRREPVIDLAAQSPHQHFEHVGKRIVVVVPHVRRDRGPIHHFSFVLQEELEQRELLPGEHDVDARPPHPMRAQVDLEIVDPSERRLEPRLPPRQRVNPRQQLAKRERLHEIV